MDAAILLSEIMRDGLPDISILNSRLGEIIQEARLNPSTGQARKIRIFGEQVNLLYMAGNIPAAVQVEKLANEITATSSSVSVFCAYSLQLDTEGLPYSLVDVHSHDLSSMFN